MSAARSITQADITRDTQLCLETAACLAFPDGTVSARILRAEAARGKLTIFRIGKKYYTTLAEIERMVSEKCHVPPRQPACTFDAGPVASQSLSSGMASTKLAQAALRVSMEKLRECSPKR